MLKIKSKSMKEQLDSTIGKNIRREREVRKLSRDELAELLDLTSSHMGLIERGERGATPVTLSKLARIFDVPIDALFEPIANRGLSLREEKQSDDNKSEANKKKVLSLITNLTDSETDFIVHVVKGLVMMNPQEFEKKEDVW